MKGMNKLAVVATALLTAIPPLALPTSAAAQDRDRDRSDRYDRGDRYDRSDGYYRRDRDYRRDDRYYGHREAWRHDRYNGYYLDGRFHYGPPPSRYYSHRGYRPAYRAWRRGDRLPAYYRSRYAVIDDYYRHDLRRPPRGYHWVRDDRGEFLLVAIATG